MKIKKLCLDRNGKELKLNNENDLNIYQMNYDEIRKYDCGTKIYDRFPDQLKIKTYKPLLSEVFDSVALYCKTNSVTLPNFNIEIKSDVTYDNIYSPPPGEYCELVLSEIFKNKMENYCIIQSFDARVLKYIHLKYPAIKLSFLSDEQQIKDLIKLGVDGIITDYPERVIKLLK